MKPDPNTYGDFTHWILGRMEHAINQNENWNETLTEWVHCISQYAGADHHYDEPPIPEAIGLLTQIILNYTASDLRDGDVHCNAIAVGVQATATAMLYPTQDPRACNSVSGLLPPLPDEIAALRDAAQRFYQAFRAASEGTKS